MTRILAIGGGGFLMKDGISPVDAHMIRLTGKSSPRVCFISTPSGDPRRRTSLHRVMNSGEIANAIAIDDHTAVMYTDGKIDHAISWKDGSTAYEVRVTGNGVEETALDARRIES